MCCKTGSSRLGSVRLTDLDWPERRPEAFVPPRLPAGTCRANGWALHRRRAARNRATCAARLGYPRSLPDTSAFLYLYVGEKKASNLSSQIEATAIVVALLDAPALSRARWRRRAAREATFRRCRTTSPRNERMVSHRIRRAFRIHRSPAQFIEIHDSPDVVRAGAAHTALARFGESQNGFGGPRPRNALLRSRPPRNKRLGPVFRS